MTLSRAIDAFIADWRAAGRINSPATEALYRRTLGLHADDVGNRPPGNTNRADVKRTLARWEHPNTQRTYRAVLVAFYDWAMEEGIRKDNPARQTRRPRARKPVIYRLTRNEAAALLEVARPGRERRIVALGLCAGARVAEMGGLQGRHFARPGWVWFSADIAKGARERWVPVIDDLADVVAEIRERVADDRHVVPSGHGGHYGPQRRTLVDDTHGASRTTIARDLDRVAKQAGIAAHVHPHLLRHAFGDHVARYAGLRAAQALLGHASVETTQQTYVGDVTLDELAIALRGLSYRRTSAETPSTPDPAAARRAPDAS